MGRSEIIPGIGILSLADLDFCCPNCKKQYGEEFYMKQLMKSKQQLIYKICTGCREKMGITYDMRGDTVVWLKKDEEPR